MNPLLVLGTAMCLAVTPVAALVFLGGGSVAAQAGGCGAEVAPSSLGPLSADQTSNATVIIDVGKRLAVPSRGQVIAVATALQESRLRNLAYGDADSLGLFQQRPSQGWGSPSQILDPAYAATQFYNHLLAVPGWEFMPLAQAAQAVQRSAFPDAYAAWQGEAVTIVGQLGGGDPTVTAPTLPTPPDTPGPDATPASPSAAPTTDAAIELDTCGAVDLPPSAVGAAVSFAASQVGKPYVLGATGPDAWDCSALVEAAYAAGGLRLPRTADEQYDYARAHGQVFRGQLTRAQLRPGDLLFSPGDDPVPAADGTPIGHVALYAGSGVVIEAKGAAWGVISTTYTPTQFARVTFVGRLVAPAPAITGPAAASAPTALVPAVSRPSRKATS